MSEPAQNGEMNGEKEQTRAPEQELAQAFKELAQGEQQATKMEGQLDALEKRIDELLQQAEQQHKANGTTSKADPGTAGKGKDT